MTHSCCRCVGETRQLRQAERSENGVACGDDAVQLTNEKEDRVAHIIGRHGGAAIVDQHAVVSRGSFASCSVEKTQRSMLMPAKRSGGDAAHAQDRIEFVVPETGEAVLVHDQVARIGGHLVDHRRAPFVAYENAAAAGRRGIGIGRPMQLRAAFSGEHQRQVCSVAADAPIQPDHRQRTGPNSADQGIDLRNDCR